MARAVAEDGRAADAAAVDAAHMLAIAAESQDETIRWNERALELAEASDDERAQRWRASLLNNLGWARHDGGDYETALDLFEQALAERQKRGPNQETRIARWCVARCLRSLGRLEEALAQQRELLAEEGSVRRDGRLHLGGDWRVFAGARPRSGSAAALRAGLLGALAGCLADRRGGGAAGAAKAVGGVLP